MRKGGFCQKPTFKVSATKELRVLSRLATRREHSAPLMEDLHNWLQAQLAKPSRNHDLAKAINYMLRRWPAFTHFLDYGRVCLSNNAAERALRCLPLGRKALLFCGSVQRLLVAQILVLTRP